MGVLWSHGEGVLALVSGADGPVGVRGAQRHRAGGVDGHKRLQAQAPHPGGEKLPPGPSQDLWLRPLQIQREGQGSQMEGMFFTWGWRPAWHR